MNRDELLRQIRKAAKTALDDANSKLDLMMAAGTANCS
jgi:hypothetical protein